RWHLMENASAAFLDVVRKSMRAIRTEIGATTINPALLTCAERLQYDSYLRREDVNSTMTKLSSDGVPIKKSFDNLAIAAEQFARSSAVTEPMSSVSESFLEAILQKPNWLKLYVHKLLIIFPGEQKWTDR
ncbi:hypothetical protein ACC664_37015, partial [Rhizobium johnstonii]